LSVYAFTPTSPNQSFLQAPIAVTAAQVDAAQVRFDPVFQEQGPYISTPGTWYPFTNLWAEKATNVTYQDNLLSFTSQVPQPQASGNLQLQLPSELETTSLPTSLFYEGDTVVIRFQVPLKLKNGDTVLWQTQPILPITISTGIQAKELIVNLGVNQ